MAKSVYHKTAHAYYISVYIKLTIRAIMGAVNNSNAIHSVYISNKQVGKGLGDLSNA